MGPLRDGMARGLAKAERSVAAQSNGKAKKARHGNGVAPASSAGQRQSEEQLGLGDARIRDTGRGKGTARRCVVVQRRGEATRRVLREGKAQRRCGEAGQRLPGSSIGKALFGRALAWHGDTPRRHSKDEQGPAARARATHSKEGNARVSRRTSAQCHGIAKAQHRKAGMSAGITSHGNGSASLRGARHGHGSASHGRAMAQRNMATLRQAWQRYGKARQGSASLCAARQRNRDVRHQAVTAVQGARLQGRDGTGEGRRAPPLS